MRIVGVTGGVDTHADSHVAAAIDDNGGLLGVESFPATESGFEDLLGWLVGFGEVVRVGVEGTGSWGVGLARFLHAHEVVVVEVDRPNRQTRRRQGKSDPTDAVSAARAALSGVATVVPKSRNGAVEEMRVLMVARRSARQQRIQSLNQLRHLVFTAPEEIRTRFKDRYKTGLVTEAANMRPRKESDPIIYTTNVVIRGLARRIQGLNTETTTIDRVLTQLISETAPSLLELHGIGVDTAASLLVAAGDNPDRLNSEIKQIDRMLGELIRATAPSLLDLHGIGVDTAASLLVTAGDNPDRLHSERSWAHLCGVTPIPASSGKVTRHRLNRGGDRQANAALHRIVLTRMSSHPQTRVYVARRRSEGLSTPEIMRCLKRYVARQTFKHLTI